MTRADRTWLTPAETAPGPSPWMVCTRPRCGLVFRRLAFVAPGEIVACPMCDQVVSGRTHGRRLTRLLRRALVVAAHTSWPRTVAPDVDRWRAA